MRRRTVIWLRTSFVVAVVLCVALAPMPVDASRQEDDAVERRAGDVVIEPHEFVAADGTRVDAELGRLYVPEDHDNKKGKLIEVAFVRFKSTSETPGSPIVYLAGGPGGSGISAARGDRFPLFMSLREVADVIAFDQRGTGLSTPSLACTGRFDLPLDRPGTHDVMLEHIQAKTRECAESMREQGIDLSAYNTRQSVEDLELLREALGAKKLTLWAISYGTHLALAAIREHGKQIDRAILAGLEGPDDTLKLPSNTQTQLETIHELVKKDEVLSRLVPDFLGLVRTVLGRLEKHPVTVQFTDPETNDRVRVTVGKFDLQVATAMVLGDRNAISQLPLAYYAMSKGDYTRLGYTAMQLRRRPIGSAMSYAMDCASGATSSRSSRITKEAKATLLGDAINFPFPDVCKAWSVVDLGNSYRSLVRSKVPVLLISGTLDGRTPVSNAEDAMRGLSNAVHLIVDGAAHSDDLFLSSPKIADTMLEFLKDQPVTTTAIDVPFAFAR